MLKSLTKNRVIPFTLSAILVLGVILACTNQSKAKPNFIFKSGGKPGIVAKIGNEEITEEELIGDAKLDFFDLKKREYDMKIEQLNELLVKKLIGAEAKKAGMDTTKYIKEKIAGKTKISDTELKAFAKEKRIPDAQLNDQLKERIRNYLTEQKEKDVVQNYLAKLTKSNPVEVYFTKPKMKMDINLEGAPVFGKDNATVTVVEFSDFQCPFCSRAATTMKDLKKKYGGKIKVAFKHFPLPFHKEAKPASEMSMCVAEQGSDKFWKFYDIVFENQKSLAPADLEKYAQKAGADLKKAKACMDSKKYADFVQKDIEYGEKIGVKSTPTFFINGQLLSGAVPIETFSEIIDDELADAKK